MNFGHTIGGMTGPQTLSSLVRGLRALRALTLLLAIALIPVVIVAFEGASGAIWVARYVTGRVTAPVVALGALRAMADLNEVFEFNIVIGFVAFGLLVIFVSVVAAFWSFWA
jgi:hypothetical protein